MHPQHTRRAILLCAAGITAVLLVVLLAAKAEASPLGISDAAVLEHGGFDTAQRIGATWVRFQVRPGEIHRYDAGVREAKSRGFKVMVSPLAPKGRFGEHAADLAERWPLAAITTYNEPEINGYGKNPCRYKRDTLKVRTAIRHANPNVTVIMGELSPHGSFEWLQRLANCKGAKLRLRNLGVHPYQFSTDPLDSKQRADTDGKGDWLGIGRLGRVKRWLAKPSTRRAFGVTKTSLWITEFGYLRSRHYATDTQISAWWPRAMLQAERLNAKVIMAQGALTPPSQHRNWNSDLPTAAKDALAARFN